MGSRGGWWGSRGGGVKEVWGGGGQGSRGQGVGVKELVVVEVKGWGGRGGGSQGVGWWGSTDGSSLCWELRGRSVGLLPPPFHPTTHTPLLPSPPRPYPLTLPPWMDFY